MLQHKKTEKYRGTRVGSVESVDLNTSAKESILEENYDPVFGSDDLKIELAESPQKKTE